MCFENCKLIHHDLRCWCCCACDGVAVFSIPDFVIADVMVLFFVVALVLIIFVVGGGEGHVCDIVAFAGVVLVLVLILFCRC